MTLDRAAASQAVAARRGLTLLALVALLGVGAAAGYLVLLVLVANGRATTADATSAFALVRSANTVVLIAIPVVWFLLLRWLRTSLERANAQRKPGTAPTFANINRIIALCAIPGPLIGQPGRVLVTHLADRSGASGEHGARGADGVAAARWAGRISMLVAPLWLGGLIRSHVDHPAVFWVALGWVALASVALLLRHALGAAQQSEVTVRAR